MTPMSGTPGCAGQRPPDRPDELMRAAPICPPPGYRRSQFLALRAWLAARSGEPKAERSALEELFDARAG